MDPYYEQGRRVREHGYNSPFEEFAIAELLRSSGVRTIHPRAIYRTGHETARAAHLVDARRYETHRDWRVPGAENEPLLSPRHDYYTIWGYFRGIDPLEDYRETRHWGLIDLAQARQEHVIGPREHRELAERIRARLRGAGIDATTMEDAEFLLRFDARGTLKHDANRELEVTFSMDALTAYECGLLDELVYRTLIECVRTRLEDIGCEALNLGGSHLLLAAHPDGRIVRDVEGQPLATLCNFELVKVKWERWGVE